MGWAVNQIAAVGVPVMGGLLWSTIGYQVTFLAGAATCVLSVLAALAIRIERVPAARHIPDEHPEGSPLAAMVAVDGHAEGPASASRALSACAEAPGDGKRLVYERDE